MTFFVNINANIVKIDNAKYAKFVISSSIYVVLKTARYII